MAQNMDIQNMQNDPVYAEFLKKKKKKKAIVTIILFLLIIFAVACVIVLVNKNKKPAEKPVMAYEDIAFPSKDITSFEFAINGNVFYFPPSIEKLEKTGYHMKSTDNHILTGTIADGLAGYTTFQTAQVTMESEELNSSFSMTVANLDRESHMASECQVMTIFADKYFMLCNGVSMASSYEDVLSIMGDDPKENKVTDYVKELTYSYERVGGTVSYLMTFRKNDEGEFPMDSLMMTFKLE